MEHEVNHAELTQQPVGIQHRTSILVCINDNDHSRVALKFACAKAKKTGCSVSLLHVMEPPDYQGLAMVVERMDSDKREQAEKLLQDMAKLAYDYAGVTPVLIMKEGGVGKETVQAINLDNNIGMLIVGTSPETPGKGKLLPWLASQLGKDLLIPMVIVPGNLTNQQIDALV